MPGLFHGLFEDGIAAMIRRRRRRAAAWLLGLGTLPAVLGLCQVEDPARGGFKVRPAERAELRAPLAGFLRAVYLDEGERASPGAVVAQLEVPDLPTRRAQKRAEVDRARAELRLLEVGARPEEIAAQREHVVRVGSWRDQARSDLERLRRAHREELEALRLQVVQGRVEHTAADAVLQRVEALRTRGFSSAEQLHEAVRRAGVAAAQLEQAEAQLRALQAAGTLPAEAELAHRDQDLADAAADLTRLEAASRSEERAAARARLAQLEEEASYLDALRAKLTIVSPLRGLVVTPRLREKVGQYFREGDLIGEIQAVSALEAEIALDEGAAARVRPGQAVELKARALAFATFRGRVERVAPTAVSDPTTARTTVTVRCRLEGPATALKPEMTGYARIACGPRPLGEILAERLLRFLRTAFWL